MTAKHTFGMLVALGAALSVLLSGGCSLKAPMGVEVVVFPFHFKSVAAEIDGPTGPVVVGPHTHSGITLLPPRDPPGDDQAGS